MVRMFDKSDKLDTLDKSDNLDKLGKLDQLDKTDRSEKLDKSDHCCTSSKLGKFDNLANLDIG